MGGFILFAVLLLTISIVPLVLADNVVVVSPNGGETLRQENNYNITWSSNLPSNTYTVIKILRGDDSNGQGVGGTNIQGQVSLFVTTNTGSWNWKVPNPADIKCINRCTAPGNMFKVQIYYPQNNDYTGDISDSYFTILDSNGNPQNVSFSCTEVGNVTDYYHQSKVVITGDSNSPYLDECLYNSKVDKTYLYKYSCGADGNVQSTQFICPNGCSNGACITQIISQCKDSDDGKNPTILGKAETQTGGQGDWCDYSKGENKIYEAYCINQTDFAIELMDCPTDKPYCNKGKCTTGKPKCSEDDGGKNPLVLGTTFPSRIADHTGATDYCQITSTGQPPESGECSGADCSLREFFCVDGSPDEFYNDISCPSGCKNGVCSKIEPTEETGPINILEETEGVKEEIKVVKEDCNGCILDKKCYPIGYRMENTYCDNQQFSNQKEADASCNNNFECSTNLCIDNECVSSGLWQKILRFFKNLLG